MLKSACTLMMMRSRFLSCRVSVALLAVVAVAGCGSARERAARPTDLPTSRVLITAPPSAALARHAAGGLLVGPLVGGPIGFVTPRGRLVDSGLRVPQVRTDGQRGLLSLAFSPSHLLYASWVPRGSDRLVVGILDYKRRPGIIWNGPRTSRYANGGHLEFAPDGRLVIGIGESGARPREHGAMLSLEPNGPPWQTPRVLSVGWNNPFAFAFTPDGSLWVADNATGNQPERLARGDGGQPYEVTDLPRETAPSGLAALPNGDLALCGVVSGTLDRYRHEPSGHWKRIGTIATGCRYGVVPINGGLLAYAEREAIRVVHP